jgi:solute carrier family 41
MFFVLVPIFCYYSHRNDFVKDALYNGWIPIIAAMVISSTGGFIMGFAVRVYKDIAVFQPVVNGVG